MTRTIAEQAFWSAARAFDSGDDATCRDFLAFSVGICPDIESSVEWRRLRVKRWLGPSVCRRLRPALSRLQALLALRPLLTPQRSGLGAK